MGKVWGKTKYKRLSRRKKPWRRLLIRFDWHDAMKLNMGMQFNLSYYLRRHKKMCLLQGFLAFHLNSGNVFGLCDAKGENRADKFAFLKYLSGKKSETYPLKVKHFIFYFHGKYFFSHFPWNVHHVYTWISFCIADIVRICQSENIYVEEWIERTLGNNIPMSSTAKNKPYNQDRSTPLYYISTYMMSRTFNGNYC